LERRNRKPVSPSAGQSVMETGAPLCTPVPVSEISPAIVVCRAPIKPLMAPVGPRAVFLSSLLSSGTTPSPPIGRLSLALSAAPGVLCLFGPGRAVQSGQTLTLTPGGDKSRFLSLYYRGHVVTRRCSSFAFFAPLTMPQGVLSRAHVNLNSPGDAGRREFRGRRRRMIRQRRQQLRRPGP
jgi:hypothetical protein